MNQEPQLTEIGRVQMPVDLRFLVDLTTAYAKRYGKGCKMKHDGEWLVFYAPDETKGESKAAENARLCAAAPDMLEALERLVALDGRFKSSDYSESGTHPGAYDCYAKGRSEIWQSARAAIAKAKGEEK